MSRSNVPANQPVNWPPTARSPQEYAGPETTGRPAQRMPVQAAPQTGYAQQPSQQPAYPPQAQYAAYPDQQPPYADPATLGRGAPFQSAQRPQQAYPGELTPPTAGRGAQGGAPPYMPQFDPYVPPSQPPHYAQPAAYGQQQPAFAPQPPYDAQRPVPQFGQRAPGTAPIPAQATPLDAGLSQLTARPQAPRAPESAFQQLQQHPAWAQQQPAPQPGAHGFDLGHFMPPARNEETTAGRRAAQGSDLNFADWPRQTPAFGQAEQHAQLQPTLGRETQFETDAFTDGFDQHASELEQAHEGEDEAHYEYEEPKKRSNLYLVAGALVAAVVVGSGLAYTYQKILGGSGAQSAAVIKTDGAPSKVKPAEPGGKQFANVDSKVMGRLSENGAPITTASTGGGDADPAAPRKVSTIAVGRDGSLAAPAPAAEPPAGGAQPTVAVPGLTIVDGFGGRQPPRPAAAASVAPQQPVVVTPPPAAAVKPVVTAKAAPAATADTDIDLSAAEPAVAPKKPVVPKKKVVDAYGAAGSAVTAAGAAAAAPAAAAPPVTSSGANGFIPVLASVPVSSKSRMDALKQFADMQQKYATVLGDKTPDVQEANLGEKGTYHRLLAGPPGSREQASHVCGQLKAAGYTGCWVTAY